MKTYEVNPIDGRKSFYGKAIVEEQGDSKRLFSYDTLVAKISEGKVTLYPDWDYSATTLRHVRAFLEANGFTATSKKQIAKQYA